MYFEFDFTQDKLEKLIPNCAYGVEYWFPELDEMLPIFGITTVARVSAFIAQTSHESNGYSVLKENLNYKAETLMRVWPKRFPNIDIANQYARNPEKIANFVYANRMGNGSTESGDGYRYCGRGLLQLTGYDNYKAFADYAGIDVDDAPSYIETPRGAVHSACWFWYVNDCSSYADAVDMEGLSQRINGGTIGMEDRIAKYNKAVHILAS